jgi:hypothetical protein
MTGNEFHYEAGRDLGRAEGRWQGFFLGALLTGAAMLAGFVVAGWGK